jgi:DNA-binding MarR family transcriptional regulator
MNKNSNESVNLSYVMELSSFFHRVMRIIAGPNNEKKTNAIRYYILKILEQKKKLNLTEISEALFLKKNTLSQLLDRMVNDELIKRQPDTLDRRKIILCLTPKGKKGLIEFEETLIAKFKKYGCDTPQEEKKKKEFSEAIENLVMIIRNNQDEINKFFACHASKSEEI